MAETFGSLARQPAHRSFWREALARRAGDRPLDEWLVEQANRHGIYGATGRSMPSGAPEVRLEDVVVGLLMPHGPADGRLFKLVVRILQSGRMDPAALVALARRERAEGVLWWLVELIPEAERNDAVEAVARVFGGPPRGYRPPRYRYDPARLLGRVNRERKWAKHRRP